MRREPGAEAGRGPKLLCRLSKILARMTQRQLLYWTLSSSEEPDDRVDLPVSRSAAGD
jgi:hypothetical protein